MQRGIGNAVCGGVALVTVGIHRVPPAPLIQQVVSQLQALGIQIQLLGRRLGQVRHELLVLLGA